MKQWAQTLQATVQMASELVARDWSSTAEWQAGSAVPRELFVQVVQWMEAFAGQTTGAAFLLQREQKRMLAKQVRDELFALLAELEPQQALALLCSLPSAGEMGYSQPHFAQFAGLSDLQVQEWEQQAYRRLQEVVSQRTPFLQFVAEQVWGEGAGDGVHAERLQVEEGLRAEGLQTEGFHAEGLHVEGFHAEGLRAEGLHVEGLHAEGLHAEGLRAEGLHAEGLHAEGLHAEGLHAEELTPEALLPKNVLTPHPAPEQARLLQEARWNPRFDLRLFMKPTEELSIRKRVHQVKRLDPDRVETLFGNQAPFLVRLVMERMKLEMAEGEEERAYVDDGSA